MAGRAIKSLVGGVTLKLFQAGLSFVLEAPLFTPQKPLCGAPTGCQAYYVLTIGVQW